MGHRNPLIRPQKQFWSWEVQNLRNKIAKIDSELLCRWPWERTSNGEMWVEGSSKKKKRETVALALFALQILILLSGLTFLSSSSFLHTLVPLFQLITRASINANLPEKLSASQASCHLTSSIERNRSMDRRMPLTTVNQHKSEILWYPRGLDH